MAKYDVAYTCGHTDTVNLIGPHRYRESRIAYLEQGECFECYKQHSTEMAREQAEALELPALVGTEKQVAWAETLRIEKLTEIETTVESLEKSNHYRQILVAAERIGNETSAKQWIEWRYVRPLSILDEVLKALKAEPTEEQRQAEQEAKAKADAIRRAALVEATLRPAQAVSELSAEISISNKTISVVFPEARDDFNALVRRSGYIWQQGCWQRTLDAYAGMPIDRAVELGHTLLAHGFLVRIFDEEIRTKVVAGDFTPEHTRWIIKLVGGNYAGWLAIKWNSQREDYYRAVRKIEQSRYDRPYVVVSPIHFQQVLDFAQMYDFHVSKGAQEAIRLAQEDKEKMLLVPKASIAKQEKVIISDTPPVLVVPELVAIADDLRDE